MVARGEISWTDFGDPAGSSPGYRRPAVVVTSDRFNRSRIKTVIVLRSPRALDWAVDRGNVTPPDGLLPKPSVINVTALFTAARDQLVDYVADVPALNPGCSTMGFSWSSASDKPSRVAESARESPMVGTGGKAQVPRPISMVIYCSHCAHTCKAPTVHPAVISLGGSSTAARSGWNESFLDPARWPKARPTTRRSPKARHHRRTSGDLLLTRHPAGVQRLHPSRAGHVEAGACRNLVSKGGLEPPRPCGH